MAHLHLNASSFLTVITFLKELSKHAATSVYDNKMFWDSFQTNDHHKLLFFSRTLHFHRMSHNSQCGVGSNLCNLLQRFG